MSRRPQTVPDDSPPIRWAKRSVRGGVRVAQGAAWLVRRATETSRVLPGFLVVGSQKCGTTSLFNYLAQHPAVVPPLRKEIHFFDGYGGRYGRGIGWYRSTFPTRWTMSAATRAAGRPAVTGEATPSYLDHPATPERVHQALPDVRLIALLRNPVDRAYSHYQMEVSRGDETLPFAEAVEREEERLAGEVDRVLTDPSYFSRPLSHFSYLRRGRYAEHLEAWTRLFPRERLLVLRAEDLYADPAAVYRRVLDFLGIPAAGEPSFRAYNAREYPDLDPALRARLADHFRPYNQRLTEFLRTDPGWD